VSDPNLLGIDPQTPGIKTTLDLALALRQQVDVVNARANGIELESAIDPDLGSSM